MVELFPESPAWSKSPRMSFSHDFPQTPPPLDAALRHPLLDSPSDFQFFSADSYSCSADDLFSHGRILPLLHPDPPQSESAAVDSTTQYPATPPPRLADRDDAKRDDTMRDIMKPIQEEEVNTNTAPAKDQSKNFWGFRRSSSLNSDGGSKLSLLCNLPLLLRSNSTGSVNQTQKKDQSKSAHKSSKRFMQPPPVSNTASSSSLPKPVLLPPLKKNDKSRPVLNVPPPYISPGTANLFGFGYFFRHGKDNSTGKARSNNIRRSTTTC